MAREQVIVCGMETHVCVLQTVLGLLALGKQVFVVEDACDSRTPASKAAGLARMRASRRAGSDPRDGVVRIDGQCRAPAVPPHQQNLPDR